MGLFLISNPIGWGTALVLAVGTTAVGYMSGKIARTVYSLNGEKIDFITGTGVDSICLPR